MLSLFSSASRWRDSLILLALFAVTRAAIVIIGALTVTYFPSMEGDQYTHLLDGGAALDMWYRWDAGFYTSIATYGYDWQIEGRPADDMAFMPLYPLAIRAVSGLTPEGCALSPYYSTCTTIGGVIVSNAALLGATFLLFELVRRRFDRATAWRAAILLLVSPISVYLSGLYTESLFLFLTLLAFLMLDRDKFALAIIPAALACLTRSVGVAFYPALLWLAWQSPKEKRPLRLLLAHIPPFAFAGYILLAGASVGDPLAYFKTYESTWGRAPGSPIEAFTVYFSGESVSLFGWDLSWIDLILTLAYLALALIVLRRDRAWGLFALVALLVPLASGTLVSMPRYGAALFPFYVLIAAWANVLWRVLLTYGASIGLGLLFLTRFVTWRWIA